MARKTDSSDEKLDPSLIHKKKARRRLVGALAFLGATAIALPFLLDAEPKPGTPQEVQIHVPAREPASPDAAAETAPPAPGALASSTPPVVPLPPPDAAPVRPQAGLDATPPPDQAAKDEGLSDAAKAAAEKKEAEKKEAAKKEAAKKDSAKSDKKDETTAAKTEDKKRDEHKGGYSVQIGAYSHEEAAKEQLAKASKLGLKTYAEKISIKGGSRYRARVGPFASREQAEQALAKLKLNGIDAAIVAP